MTHVVGSWPPAQAAANKMFTWNTKKPTDEKKQIKGRYWRGQTSGAATEDTVNHQIITPRTYEMEEGGL